MTAATLPAPPPPPAPPDAPTAAEGGRRPAWLDIKSVIAILIGIVSVTGAVVTWRAAVLAELATDKDRQAVAETVLRQRNAASSEIVLEAENLAFARYRADLSLADQLDAEADGLERAGDDERATQLRNDATVHRRVAEELSLVRDFGDYVITDDAGNPVSLDVERRRDDLLRGDTAASQVDPKRTIAQADDLRERSQRLVGWIVVFVGGVVLLTIAQLVGNRILRVGFAGAAVVVYLVATGGALIGG